MIDLLFGVHVGGWQAAFQFWFWVAIFYAGLIRWFSRR